MSEELTRLDTANRALALVKTAMEAKKISDFAVALEVLAIRQRNAQAQSYAHAIHADALRLEGEFLAVEKCPAGRPRYNPSTGWSDFPTGQPEIPRHQLQ